MYELFIGTFVTFFVVIDPVGIAPIFAVLTEGSSPTYKRRMVIKATFIGGLILLFFAYLGSNLMATLGISMSAFRTAGGILLFMIALEMIFEKRAERREKNTEGLAHEHGKEGKTEFYPDEEYEDISVFPFAIPFIAGPGSITTSILLMNQNTASFENQGIILAALLAVLLATFIMLSMASKIMSIMGKTIANVITRILGVILAAMAIQFVFDGIKMSFFGV